MQKLNFNYKKSDPLQREYTKPRSLSMDIPVSTDDPGPYYFRNFTQIAESIILGINVRDDASGKTLTNKDILNSEALHNCYLTLSANGFQLFDSVPLSLFINTGDNVGDNPLLPFSQVFIPQKLDTTRSYIEFADGGSSIGADEAVEITFYFDDPAHENQTNLNNIADRIDPARREYPIPMVKTVNILTDPSPPFKHPDDDLLARSHILGLLVRLSGSEVTFRANNSGASGGLITQTDADSAFITIESNGDRIINDEPLTRYSPSSLVTYYPLYIPAGDFDPTECEIKFAGGGSVLDGDESIELTWIYFNEDMC